LAGYLINYRDQFAGGYLCHGFGASGLKIPAYPDNQISAGNFFER